MYRSFKKDSREDSSEVSWVNSKEDSRINSWEDSKEYCTIDFNADSREDSKKVLGRL